MIKTAQLDLTQKVSLLLDANCVFHGHCAVFLENFPKAAFAFMGNGGGNGQKQTEPGSLLMIIEPSRLCGERAPSPQIRVNYS